MTSTQQQARAGLPALRRFEGKVALVTGAAKGQGRSHALRLAAEGASLVLLDIGGGIRTTASPQGTSEQLDDTAAAARALGADVVHALADVRDRARMTELVEQAVDRFGRLDVALANAGIVQLKGVLDITDEDWTNMIGVNLTGVWNTIRAVLPPMLAAKAGSIVVTGSAAGVKGPPGMAHYAASKAGQLGLLRSVANEVGPVGVRVNAVLPTMVGTDMIHGEDSYRTFRPDLANPGRDDVAPVFASMNVLPVPWVEVEDVTNAVLWLASDEARYVHGVALPVDAGTIIK